MIQYTTAQAAYSDILNHLETCKNNFIPPLQETVDISSYSQKINSKSVTFEAWQGGHLIGLIAAYFNDPGNEFGFITSVSVEEKFAGKGIATGLLNNVIQYALANKFSEIRLKVHSRNSNAINLYEKHKFIKYGTEENFQLYRLLVN
ncbi:MAG: GNAT family N-acetyltransferase [Ferruginibacter sp.]